MIKKVLFYVPLSALSLLLSWQSVQAEPVKRPQSMDRKFTREEYMVLNLDRGADSAGAHVNDALKSVHEIVKELDRSLRQLQQVDKEFAKSKGKPDDRFLGNASDRLQDALNSAQQLERQLGSTKDELKDNIHQALIMAQ